MKIDGKRLEFNGPLNERVESKNTAGSPATQKAAGTSGDLVRVSPDVQLANDAIRAALAAPEIRADVVARAKALVSSGELGANAERLSDALIERSIIGERGPS